MSNLSALVRELKLARQRVGLSQEDLAAKMNVSVSLVAKVETGVVPPSLSYVKAAASALPPDPEIYVRMREDGLTRPIIGDWLRSWLDLEGQADTIRWFEVNVIPGILQVEGYVRALLTDEDAITTRLQRKHILQSAKVATIIDEAALADRDVRWEVRQRWESLLSEALPRTLSQELITRAAERWRKAS